MVLKLTVAIFFNHQNLKEAQKERRIYWPYRFLPKPGLKPGSK
jgi:hypothetical protein